MCKGGVAVHGHRFPLSMASPVLKDILAASAPPPPATARATAAAGRKRQKTAAAAASSSAAAVGSAPLELPCGDDCPAMWSKVLTFLYPVGPGEQRLNWKILEPVLRLADKCARTLLLPLLPTSLLSAAALPPSAWRSRMGPLLSHPQVPHGARAAHVRGVRGGQRRRD
jgi:hypothetical protein